MQSDLTKGVCGGAGRVFLTLLSLLLKVLHIQFVAIEEQLKRVEDLHRATRLNTKEGSLD